MKLNDLYQKGAAVLTEKKLDFMLKGVETEFVLEHNAAMLAQYTFLQRAINTIQEVSTRSTVLNVELETPVIMSSMNAPIPQIADNGLVITARALKKTGSMMWTGSPIPTNLEEIVKTGVPVCQTVKPLRDRKALKEKLIEIEKTGVTWIGIEVDAGQCTKVLDTMMTKDCFPVSVSELKELKAAVSIPFVLKGILSAWDAEKALEAEADLIVISNHGAHTLDYLPHPFEVIEEINAVINGRIPIIVDSGFRRGSDVLKGLAMGAAAVGIARPVLWALAADGEEGVASLITELTEELKRYMTMTGIEQPKEAHPSILLRSPHPFS